MHPTVSVDEVQRVGRRPREQTGGVRPEEAPRLTRVARLEDAAFSRRDDDVRITWIDREVEDADQSARTDLDAGTGTGVG
jgi:hypothetical protein